jgi:hypothetical protein
VTVNTTTINPDGSFYLSNSEDTFFMLFFHQKSNSSRGGFYFNQVVSDSDYLNLLSTKIRNANPTTTSYSSFSATTAYTITWVITDANTAESSTLFQVALCTDMHTSFMVVSYAELNIPSDDQCCYFNGTLGNKNSFQASTTDSNSNVPGQFVFPLTSAGGMIINFFLQALIFTKFFIPFVRLLI